MSLATRNQVWDALPPMRFGEERPLDLDLDETTERQLVARLRSRDFDDWSQPCGHLMPDSEDRTRRAVDSAWAACAPPVPHGEVAGR